MEQLTAFEFIAATDGPQLVRLKRGDIVLAQLVFVAWVGLEASVLAPDLEMFFERREDLVVEGMGIARPYWNGERPPWAESFDPAAEARRLRAIRVMAAREANRISLSMS